MNSACSTCLESFTSRSEISSTPCGHVFHTKCIKKWLNPFNGHNNCSQCRKPCNINQITKLYFSESQSETDLVNGLEETIRKLRSENLKISGEKLQLEEENLRLSNHIDDLNKNSKTIEKNLRKQCEEYAERVRRAENGENLVESKENRRMNSENGNENLEKSHAKKRYQCNFCPSASISLQQASAHFVSRHPGQSRVIHIKKDQG